MKLDELVQFITPLNNGASTGRTFNNVQGKYTRTAVEGEFPYFLCSPT